MFSWLASLTVVMESLELLCGGKGQDIILLWKTDKEALLQLCVFFQHFLYGRKGDIWEEFCAGYNANKNN
jgi:hypothetical protein